MELFGQGLFWGPKLELSWPHQLFLVTIKTWWPENDYFAVNGGPGELCWPQKSVSGDQKTYGAGK